MVFLLVFFLYDSLVHRTKYLAADFILAAAFITHYAFTCRNDRNSHPIHNLRNIRHRRIYSSPRLACPGQFRNNSGAVHIIFQMYPQQALLAVIDSLIIKYITFTFQNTRDSFAYLRSPDINSRSVYAYRVAYSGQHISYRVTQTHKLIPLLTSLP